MILVALLFNFAVLGRSDILTAVDHASHIRFPPPLYHGTYDPPMGHNEPIGKQRPSEGQIMEYFAHPTPRELWDNNVKVYKPAVIRAGLRDSPAMTKWTDEYLLKEYGQEEATIEKRIEDRYVSPKRMTLEGFLGQYEKENWYVVSVLPYVMRKDIWTPKPLMCSTLAQTNMEENLWIGTGGTMSVLHYDAIHILHCLVTGRKDWILIHNQHKDKLDMITDFGVHQSGYSHIPVKSVDYEMHPEVWDVPWNHVTLRAGDCLYLPSKYLHQVRSYNRSISATFLLYPRDKFSDEDCEGVDYNKLVRQTEMHVDYTLKTGQEEIVMGYSHPPTQKEDMVNLMKLTGMTWMNSRYFLYALKPTYGTYGENNITSFFKNLDKNEDRIITMEEIEAADMSIWTDWCSGYGIPHGPTKQEREEDIKWTNGSSDFVDKFNSHYLDHHNARIFLAFLIRVKGRNGAISLAGFEKWVELKLASTTDIFKMLDINSDGILTKREVENMPQNKLREFSKVYYELKGTAISNGGKYLEELERTEIEGLKELNAIPEEMLIVNDVPDDQEAEENRDLENKLDIFLGGLKDRAQKKNIEKEDFLNYIKEAKIEEFLEVDDSFFFHLLDRGQKGSITVKDIDFYLKNENLPETPLSKYEDMTVVKQELTPPPSGSKETLVGLIRSMVNINFEMKRKAANKKRE